MGHICCTIPDVFSDLYRGLIRADDDCRMPTINHGHSPSTPMSNNQCLFVHYAKLKRRPARTGVQWLCYKLLSCLRGHLHTSKASGDHQSWEVLPPSQPPVSRLVAFVHRALICFELMQPQDPVDVLLNYILKVRRVTLWTALLLKTGRFSEAARCGHSNSVESGYRGPVQGLCPVNIVRLILSLMLCATGVSNSIHKGLEVGTSSFEATRRYRL